MNKTLKLSISLNQSHPLIRRTLLVNKNTNDLGDGWIHNIIVEKPTDELTGAYYPMCVSGALNCPPKDYGGISGFYDLLKILENSKHPEYKETKTWEGKKYSPENFDVAKTNKQLKQLQKYIARWNSRD